MRQQRLRRRGISPEATLGDEAFRARALALPPLRYQDLDARPGRDAGGTDSCDATEPAWNGYLLTVTCPCGVTFERWVTPDDVELDLLYSARLN